MTICEVHDLGLVPYAEAWEKQAVYAAEIAAGRRRPTLLLLEHPHTFTFGRRGQAQNLLWDEAECARRGVTVLWVDRGGDVTYHGPGQLVGYPLLPLAPGGLYAAGGPDGRLPQADYVGYLRKLEQALMLGLDRLGLAAGRVEGLTGVWVAPERLGRAGPPAKVAAIGVKVDAAGVSRHGFALNVAPDMRYWQGIIGCGLKDHPVTSLAELLRPTPSLEAVSAAVCAAFGEVFEYEMVRV
jgi:lipoate-protein ligase B